MSRDNPTWPQAIGHRLREHRTGLGLRQDDVARGAQGAGLDWTRATVAAVETARRPLSAEEFLLLPLALWHATRRVNGLGSWFGLADLLPQRGWIQLTKRTSAYSGALREMLSGVRPDERQPFDGEFETPGESLVADAERALDEWGRLARLWPGASIGDLERAALAATGDAERKAARKLGVPPPVLAVAAYARWGRSLTEERDRRISERIPWRVPRPGFSAPGRTPEQVPVIPGNSEALRTVQALRGHVTRALLAELSEVLAAERKGGRG